MNFGENLKNFRKNSKMSQEVLAEKVGVSRQAVSRWEVGEAYPEMCNIVALCSIFKCNINDLINDNITDVESFDKETKENIVKFKKTQQKKMKGVSKAIYIMTGIIEIILLVSLISFLVASLVFPFIASTFKIDNEKISLLNKEYKYEINRDGIKVKNQNYYIDTTSNISEFINTHDNTFFRISIEYILICITITNYLTLLSIHYLSKLFKNIYNKSTPFTLENEKLVIKAIMLVFISALIDKIGTLAYMLITNIDLSFELNIKDILILLVGISVIYIFKYGRMIQADSKAKIYD